MTRDEILAMPAGRELDELVAIKVMGSENNRTVWGQKPFEPSRNISAAWEVAEKMPLPFRVEKSYQQQFGAGEVGWMANWCDNPDYCECGKGELCSNKKEVWALNAPESICKASLLAVMGL